MSDNSEGLLRAILSVCGRQAFTPEELSKIVGGGPKQNEAFNLCDGTRGQGEIANALKLIPRDGICFDIGANVELYTLLYALPYHHVYAIKSFPRNVRWLVRILHLN